MSHTYNKLLEIMLQAKSFAIAAIKENDGGSCNLDTIRVKPIDGIEKAAKTLGLLYFPPSDGEESGTIMPPISNFQGFNRTRQCEAFAQTLCNNDIDAWVNYAID